MKLSDLFENATNLNEVLDTEFDELVWDDQARPGAGIYGTATLDGEEFGLGINPSSFTVEDEEYNFLDVQFSREVSDSPGTEPTPTPTKKFTQELISTKQPQSRQLGAVVNALKNKISELPKHAEVKAIVGIIVKGEEQRISFYSRVLSMTAPWKHRYTVNWFGGTALIATKQPLPPAQLKALSAEIKLRNKTLVQAPA